MTGPSGTAAPPPRSSGRTITVGSIRIAALPLPLITKLPSSAPFGPGVAVNSKAVLDLGAPPPVAPLEPLAGFNFASSPVFWPVLAVLDLLAVIGVGLLARRAWSRREPA
ncbi:MAG: hypothetical protein NVSMB29_19480 [Candidatus Dormibacteria bacterium]